MGIGAYRHAVTLDSPVGPLDPPTWDCSIVGTGMQVVEGITGRVLRGRYHPGINLETRVTFNGRTLQVQNVEDVEERHIELVVTCAEVVGRHGVDATN